MKNKNILLIIGSGILIVIGILFIGLTTSADETKQEEARKKIELRQKNTTTENVPLSFYIDDRTVTCVGERELIYENGHTLYYLPCEQSSTIYLVYSDSHEVTLKEALASSSVTIDELITHGLVLIEETV